MLIYASKTDIEDHMPEEFQKFNPLTIEDLKKELKVLSDEAMKKKKEADVERALKRD